MKAVPVDARGHRIEAEVQARRVSGDMARWTARAPGYRGAASGWWSGTEPVVIPCFVVPGEVDGPELEEACWRNLVAASQHTAIAGTELIAYYAVEPLELRQDRAYIAVGAGLAADIRRTGVVEPADGSLHEPHEDGFELVGSWKTTNDKAILQVTLWQRGDDELVAELDIDEGRGVTHLREVLDGELTHPYVVRDLLLWYHGIDPGYELGIHV